MTAPADLAPARIEARLRTRSLGRSLEVHAETGSTNDDARARAHAGAPNGHVIVADQQSAGRGSNGRTWSSPAGVGLYVSFVLAPLHDPARAPLVTLATGLGVADAVERLLGARGATAEIKWPNDVLLARRKCAGILAETSAHGRAPGPVIVGVGVNVCRRPWPDALAGLATSIEDARGAPVDRADALAAVLEETERWLDTLRRDGSAPIVRAVGARLAGRGERVRCGEAEGLLRGLEPSGALRLDTPEGPRVVLAGRLELLERP